MILTYIRSIKDATLDLQSSLILPNWNFVLNFSPLPLHLVLGNHYLPLCVNESDHFRFPIKLLFDTHNLPWIIKYQWK